MHGILSSAELMLDDELESDQRELAEIVFQSSEALLLIIDDILDLAEIDASGLVLDSAPFDLLAGVTEWLMPDATAKLLDLTVNVVPGTPR